MLDYVSWSACLCGRQCFDLSGPLVVIVSVDLSSKFEGSGLTIDLQRLRSLQHHWPVSCWCGCSQNRFCFRSLIVNDVRCACPQSQSVSNWNVGLLLVPACFFGVHAIGS